jgi:hypothetical protein
MGEKLSIPQAVLLSHILKFSKFSRVAWQEALENEGQSSQSALQRALGAGPALLTTAWKFIPKWGNKSLEDAENENKEDLINLLHSLPNELKDNLKQWVKTDFPI